MKATCFWTSDPQSQAHGRHPLQKHTIMKMGSSCPVNFQICHATVQDCMSYASLNTQATLANCPSCSKSSSALVIFGPKHDHRCATAAHGPVQLECCACPGGARASNCAFHDGHVTSQESLFFWMWATTTLQDASLAGLGHQRTESLKILVVPRGTE